MTLKQVERISLEDQVPESLRSGNAHYFFYDFHWQRLKAAYSWVAKYGSATPIYQINSKNRDLVYRGPFNEAFQIYSRVVNILRNLHFTHYLFRTRQRTFSVQDKELVCKIFNRTFKILNLKLKNRLKSFYIHVPVFKEPGYWSDFIKGTQSCLDKSIKLNFPFFEEELEEYVIDPEYEFHPSGQYNKALAEKIVEKLQ